MEKIAYKGWKTCYRLSNKVIDLVVTGDVGPRIIRLGFVDGPNEFAEFTEMLGLTGGDEWRIYGGHRLWHAPEIPPRTTAPDNAPITAEEHAGCVRFIQPVEAITGIQKELDVTLDPGEAHVTVVHRLRNTNLWTIELAPWALSVMAQGGKAIIPLPPRGTHGENLLSSSSITLWAYSDMSDRRWSWGTRYVMLQQEPGNDKPQKAGFWVPDGWVAYARDGCLFVKTFTPDARACYPDRGCSVEVFTNDRMLEVETLGPMIYLEPGADIEHVEHWFLFSAVPAPENASDVEAYVMPKIEAVKGA